MPSKQRWLVLLVAFGWAGCIHDAVLQGTWIGAVSGAALGAGTGVLISNEHLLGSSKESQMQLEPSSAIGAGTLVGAVFGAIIGAMAGQPYADVQRNLQTAANSPADSRPSSTF